MIKDKFGVELKKDDIVLIHMQYPSLGMTVAKVSHLTASGRLSVRTLKKTYNNSTYRYEYVKPLVFTGWVCYRYPDQVIKFEGDYTKINISS